MARDPKKPKTPNLDTMKGPKDPRVVARGRPVFRFGIKGLGRGAAALVLWMLASTTSVLAQNPCPDPGGNVPMNPTRVCMQPSADHVDIDGYAIDLILKADDTVVQTIDMGKPPFVTTPDGSDWIDWNNLNVMPRAFGAYYSVVRAYGGGVSGPDSIASNDWDRVPGRPGGPRIVRGLKWLGKGMWAGLKQSGRGLASIQHVVR